MPSNLIIAAVGDDSLHEKWLPGTGRRSFDVMLVYYGSKGDRYRSQCDHYMKSTGLKWPLLAEAQERFGEAIDKYDAVWCPDDDLSIDAASIDEMFHIFHEFDLNLAQPSLAPGSHAWFRTTRQCPFALLRFVRQVELGAPIFSRMTLNLLAHTFRWSESGWGLDMLWAKLLDYQKMAIIHAVAVTHTRPYFVGGAYSGKRPMDDARRLVQKYDLWDALSGAGIVLSTVLRSDATDYVKRLFEFDLPTEFDADPDPVKAIGVRFGIRVEGVGEWFVNASPSGPACAVGSGPADCTVAFSSRDAFLKYLEAPRGEMVGLFLNGQLEIGGRQTEARKLARVFERLYPYKHVEPEDM